ncbi:MAG: glycosyltransferase family 4 protein [Nitrospira sp.]|nr:glycosyltransferase family 4 protein [Nitrospira sp.]
MSRHRILAFVRYYLPGYKTGGPVRSLVNMVDQMSDQFEFWIVTEDRDSGDQSPYEGVPLGKWTTVGKAQVFYVPRANRGFRAVRDIVRSTPHDVMYLNSCLAQHASIIPLLLRRMGAIERRPTVLAPRGEMSTGALGFKPMKKRPFLLAARLLRLYGGIIWQASSPLEAAEIRLQLGVPDSQVVVAPDLLPRSQGAVSAALGSVAREPGVLRVIFISRIAPSKNLAFLLQVLHTVRCPLDLTIAGPVDDQGYWRRCESLIAALPPNVKVTVAGPVPYEQVPEMFAKHDLFVLPTFGENFGHAIIEALTAGTPILCSPHTPWSPDNGAAFSVMPLGEAQWKSAIEKWAQMSAAQLLARREAALRYARAYYADESALVSNRALFALAAERGRYSG